MGVYVGFLMSEARRNPQHFASVRRLEAAAAVLAVRSRQLIGRELDTQLDSIYVWSDSMVALTSIGHSSYLFKMYMANRLSYIGHGS